MSEETVDPHFKQNVETEYERAWHDDYFLRRVLTIAGIAVAIICFFLFIAATFNVLLLVFSGILVAMLLDSVRDKVAEFTGLNDHLSLAIVVGTLVVLVAGGTILFGPKIVHQLREINERIPRADFELRQELVRYEFGRDIVKVMPSRIEIANMLFSGGNERSVYTQLTGVFSTTFSIITNVVIISFIGIYLAIEPETYLGNVLRLVPEKHQPRAREVLQNIATKTKSWFLSRFFSMFVVGILTTVGLRILGVPLAMTLGFIAGLLSFIPTFGPIISLVPAALIGLIESPRTALYVILLFIIVQQIETYLITPIIERQTIDLPPALLLGAQLIAGIVIGFLGLMLAPPMVIIAVVSIRMLYIEDVLGQKGSGIKSDPV